MDVWPRHGAGPPGESPLQLVSQSPIENPARRARGNLRFPLTFTYHGCPLFAVIVEAAGHIALDITGMREEDFAANHEAPLLGAKISRILETEYSDQE